MPVRRLAQEREMFVSVVLFSRSRTALQSETLIDGNGHIVLRVIERQHYLNSFQSGIAHKTNCAFGHVKIKGFLGVWCPICDAPIINPRLGISQNRLHSSKLS